MDNVLASYSKAANNVYDRYIVVLFVSSLCCWLGLVTAPAAVR